MIPILYESNETEFVSNGICRLYDAKSVVVTEERNGVYECNFTYPVDGANYEFIQCGRIISVTHDDSGSPQPFDIVSYSKPINGIVEFHAVHVSYRLNYIVARGSGVASLDSALTMLKDSAQPENPFSYSADFLSSAYMASADGTPRSVRQFLGGVEGSILDTYGGEYEFDKFDVKLHNHRGLERDFTIRHGVNLLSYTDDVDYSNAYSSCVPYWASNGELLVGTRVDLSTATYNGRNNCIALNLTDKFEGKPSVADLRALALSQMQKKQTTLPTQNIKVDFVRLQDMGEFADYQDLLQCNLCDTVGVVFPMYGMSGRFKIVKTVYDVLQEKYKEMELGTLSVSLADALGITQIAGGAGASIGDFILEQTVNTNGIYRKWNSGYMEQFGIATSAAQSGTVGMTITLPVAFNNTSYYVYLSPSNNMNSNTILLTEVNSTSNRSRRTATTFDVTIFKSGNAYSQRFYWFAFGRWK